MNVSTNVALSVAAELGQCQVERDTYKRIAEKHHELHQDVMNALPIMEAVYELLQQDDHEPAELADMLHEGMERLRGGRVSHRRIDTKADAEARP